MTVEGWELVINGRVDDGHSLAMHRRSVSCAKMQVAVIGRWGSAQVVRGSGRATTLSLPGTVTLAACRSRLPPLAKTPDLGFPAFPTGRIMANRPRILPEIPCTPPAHHLLLDSCRITPSYCRSIEMLSSHFTKASLRDTRDRACARSRWQCCRSRLL